MAAANGQQKRYFRLSGGAPPTGTGNDGAEPDDTDGTEIQRLRAADIMVVSLRGVEYKIDKKILRSTPNSTLYKLSQEEEDGMIYINRNPALFHYVLDYYVTGQLHLPEGMCGQHVRREIAFWGLDTDVIAPCCVAKLRDDLQRADETKYLVDHYKRLRSWLAGGTWREKAWAARIKPFGSPLGMILYVITWLIYGLFLVSLMMASSLAFRHQHKMTAKVNAGNVTADVSNVTSTTGMPVTTPEPDITGDQMVLFISVIAMEGITLLAITVWEIFWLCACPDRRRYYLSVSGMIVPVSVFVQWFPDLSMFVGSHFILVLVVIRVLRVIPVLHVLSVLRPARVLGRALAATWRELAIVLFLIFLSAAAHGFLVFITELAVFHVHDGTFEHYPDGLWYGIVTMTSVGYGDHIPQSNVAQFFGMTCMLSSVILLACPVPIILRAYKRECAKEVAAEFLSNIRSDFTAFIDETDKEGLYVMDNTLD